MNDRMEQLLYVGPDIGIDPDAGIGLDTGSAMSHLNAIAHEHMSESRPEAEDSKPYGRPPPEEAINSAV